ncbi:permease [Lacrimispora sp. 210928-DFI.3.58]|uniref:permease n=1 Tax=Lacrimispora sp. 210928-DFI.3.58 TaxID=2883214 RepID=UPI001D080040|nr:permease [Lacrimispora sp. 210928-DFI.3.58]MCB7321153.1 permease [Lacrimispora sp. 210928-DFI.3.58]
MFTTETLIHAGRTFLMLFSELFGLFIGISFVVALLQIYISQERIKRILTTPKKGLNSVLGAALGAVTPFCSCSTIPVLVGLFKSGAPFCGAISFLLTSPILNPAILTLLVAFFGLKATVVYSAFTFVFAVIMGLILDKAGFEKEVKNVTVKGGHQDGISWEKLQGTFWQKQQAITIALRDSFGLFKGVVLFLLLGAGIGAFIYEFIPTDLLANFAGASNLWAVPLAAIVGIPMYIRTETMIPIASILISKGVAPGVMIALILGGAGASIPEVSLLNSIFKKKMVAAFVLCIFAVATITGYVFNFVL